MNTEANKNSEVSNNETTTAIVEGAKKGLSTRKKMSDAPTLTCVISGKSRPTTWPYLSDKAERLGTDVATLRKFYICREVLTQSKQRDVLELLHVNSVAQFNKLLKEKSYQEMVALNSRTKKGGKRQQVTADADASESDSTDGEDTDQGFTPDEPKAEVTVVESSLSPETEAYLKQRNEILGGEEAAKEIHNRVFGITDEETEDELVEA
jgi:hypothetical protein